jgi:hypothetical protein
LTEDLSVHSNLSILLLLFFVLTSLLKRLSIQYVYERVLSFYNSSIHLTCFSRVQSNKLFYFSQAFFKFIWKYNSFLNSCLSLCKELNRCWCKVASLSFKQYFLQTYFTFFQTLILTRWKSEFWNWSFYDWNSMGKKWTFHHTLPLTSENKPF